MLMTGGSDSCYEKRKFFKVGRRNGYQRVIKEEDSSEIEGTASCIWTDSVREWKAGASFRSFLIDFFVDIFTGSGPVGEGVEGRRRRSFLPY
jgi:hypothetical protein